MVDDPVLFDLVLPGWVRCRETRPMDGGSAVWALRVARGSKRDEGDQQTPSPDGRRAASRNEKCHGGLTGQEGRHLFLDQSGSLTPVERICLVRRKVAELGKVISKTLKRGGIHSSSKLQHSGEIMGWATRKTGSGPFPRFVGESEEENGRMMREKVGIWGWVGCSFFNLGGSGK